MLLRALSQTTGLGWNSAATGPPVNIEMSFCALEVIYEGAACDC